MKNFEFKNPTKIIFGKNQIEKIEDEIPKDAKILMLYGGGSIKKNGIYEQVKKALNKYDVTEFGGIEANPKYHTLLKALKIIKEKDIDFLLAVGGGSVIDGTKFLSAAALYKGDDSWDIPKNALRTTEALPFGTVLTLPATGSEMNSSAVVSNEATKEKFGMGGSGLFPQFSVLNPEVVQSIPERQIANGIADAFTHVLEQYLTYPAGGHLQDRFAEGILQTLIETAPKIMNNPSDYEAASNFMWCCTLALNGLIQKGVPTDWATHMIGHELTAAFEIDHARTLAIIGPHLYMQQFENKKAKLVQYGKRVWNINEGNEEDIAKKAIEKTVEFFHSLGIKTKLSEYTDNYKATAANIRQRFEERGLDQIGERKEIRPVDVEKIVEASY